jgi:hypothetical protein
MTPKVIFVFCIIYPSFTLLYVVFHPSPYLFISIEILNEAKLIHRYINGTMFREHENHMFSPFHDEIW